MEMATEDVDRFRALSTAQLPRLYSVARRLVGAEAEDAVQDCLLKAFRAYPMLENPDAGSAWLMTVLVNCCRDRGRRNARRMEDSTDDDDLDRFSLYRKIAAEDPFPYSDSLHLDFLAQFSREDVRAVLLSLPLLYRTPLVLVHMEGFSTKEVATMLGAPIGTVLSRLHRGRKRFESRLWEYAGEHGLLRREVLR